eukprot:scaffold69103_cov66-Phaeocystis_antarctica.AAC.3
MQGHAVQLYAILLDGALNRYPEVKVPGEQYMPSGGALSNPNDKALVTSLEDKMIEAYGTALVEVKCKAAGGKKVDLSRKMLRPMHVGALFAAVERYQVAELVLAVNQLGAAGGELVAAALKTNTTLTTLKCAQLGRPSNQVPRVGVLARPWHRHATLAACTRPFHLPLPCAQPLPQRPRPRGWHGARRGAQEQHDPQEARVCCPAIEPTRPPTRAVNATSHSLRVPRTSPARAQPKRGLRTHGAYGRPRANTLAAATRARTRRGPRPRPPLPTGVWRVRAHAPTCTCPSQPAEQRPRRRHQAGPQSGRRQRPPAVPLEQLGSLRIARETLGEVA